jgi:hypothetical protein
MGIKIRNFALLYFIMLVFASCSTTPEDMAKEYCDCRAQVDKGTKTDKDCAELAQKHTNNLQDDDDPLRVYTSTVLDCISATEMNTKK